MEIIVAPMIAVAVLNVVARDQGGISGPLMFVLGTVSGLGASALLTRGITTGSPDIFLIGLRHFTVMAYAWASIASEPPVKRRADYELSLSLLLLPPRAPKSEGRLVAPYPVQLWEGRRNKGFQQGSLGEKTI